MKHPFEIRHDSAIMSSCRHSSKLIFPLRPRISACTTSAGRGGILLDSTMQTIPPFPDNIDRKAFGSYISGFTDGEGCFALLIGRKGKSSRPTPYASFVIKLRHDDYEILSLIQSYFQSGNIVHGHTRHECDIRFRTLDQLPVIVKHFEEFPLLAKKRFDFTIWKEGVKMILDISKRYQHRLGRNHGIQHKWRKEEYEQFLALKSRLSERTIIGASRIAPLPVIKESTELFLF